MSMYVNDKPYSQTLPVCITIISYIIYYIIKSVYYQDIIILFIFKLSRQVGTRK